MKPDNEAGPVERDAAPGLDDESQYWGIVDADGERLAEFIQFYEAHTELSAAQKDQLGELILASANDAVGRGEAALPAALRPFLTRHRSDFEPHIEYWYTLHDGEKFPFAEWLRAHLPRKF
jgi:hypothetical protein